MLLVGEAYKVIESFDVPSTSDTSGNLWEGRKRIEFEGIRIQLDRSNV